MKILTTSFLLIVSFCIAFSQNASFRGNIYDSDSGDPIMFANVILESTSMGVVTDENGFFSFNKLKPGEYTMLVKYLGYDSLSYNFSIAGGRNIYEKFYLVSSGLDLNTVNVSAKKEIAQKEISISKLSVSEEELKLLPSTGGEADIAQYLPVLPGIIFTGDQGGQLFIRGGSPIQNRILLDGMTIYNPFHSIGLFSVFETEIVKNIDVYTGAFGAEYGGRTSAIVDISSKDGNAKRYEGLVSASPFQAKALIEGPLIKLDEETGKSASFILTGKRSLIQETSKSLYKYASDSLGLPFEHQDIYGKLTFNGGNGSKIDVFGFNFQDDVNVSSVANIGWTSSGGGTKFSLIPQSNNMIVSGKLNYSNYNLELDEGDGQERASTIGSYEIGLDFTYLGNQKEINYGFEIIGLNTDFQFTNFTGFNFENAQNTNEIGAFFNYRQVLGNLVIEPGVRVQYYNAQGAGRVEPRIGVKYNVTDNIRLKAGAGMYSQNVLATSNDRDIVNLFYGILTGPEQEVANTITGETLDNNLQLSQHLVAGVEIDLGSFTTINIEPYIKDFNQNINLNQNKQSATESDYIFETGLAQGIDFSLKHQQGDIYLWTTYSYGIVERDNGEQEYYTSFDRRHNANILLSYTFGLSNQWESSIRWNFGTGFPFTLTQGFFGSYQTDEGVFSDIPTQNPDLEVIYDEEINAGRLPSYHRLDASLKRIFKLSETSVLEVVASVTNAYDRQNIFYFDRVEYDRVDQLPIIPSLGITYRF